MKHTILLSLFTIISYTLVCQSTLLAFDQQRINYDKKAMLVLGSWSATNIVASAIGTNSDNRQSRYFHQMNVIWNGSNLLVAGLGYWGASKQKADGSSLTRVLRHQNSTEKTFLFNTGLDVAYIASGLYLTERSRRNADPAKLKGYGNAVMVQGGFLLLFDAIMFGVHNHHGRQLKIFTDKVAITSIPTGIGMLYKL